MLPIMHIFVTGSLADAERAAWLRALAHRLPAARLHTTLASAADAAAVTVAVVANPPPGSLAGLSGLRLIQSVWAGVDRLLADPTLPADVPLARMVDPVMTAAMVQTGVWAVLSLHRRFDDYARQQAAGQWRVWPQVRAGDCRVLVLGLGEMGTALAARLLSLGYPVSGWRARPGHGAAPAGLLPWQGPEQLDAALAQADVLVNLLPLTPATRGLLDARRLARLPAGATLVNLARGAHVVEADLLAALDAGHLRHAVLDVFAAEPLPSDHPFWQHPRVTVLPHAAAQTDIDSAADQVALNVVALQRGLPLRHLVSRERGY